MSTSLSKMLPLRCRALRSSFRVPISVFEIALSALPRPIYSTRILFYYGVIQIRIFLDF